ncbi:PQQ-dependent sugar dehydrogenase [Rhodospirillum centenum]|uniref:Glucose/sorbosone dehydrogenase, putative n=1 Tax=Rhodospirillum centenum (strain ATCC 51521 / SW) TaxID=414684 RepID=B6IPU3_RHOCS|nr:PQQ-dependent sugar dehydrogenase [Rhodospirillum centenum]ACI97479.1 glucose/sorbosone dehydrogenase, putative [Rhodospirillum centenum SW]
MAVGLAAVGPVLGVPVSAGALAAPREFNAWPAPAARQAVKVTTVVDGLDHPWSVAFLPDGRLLVTERTGRLRTVQEGRLLPEPVAGLPPIEEVGQGGLLEVALHPDHARNRLVYISYAEPDPSGRGHRTAIARFRDGNGTAEGFEVLYRGTSDRTRHHFGSRIVFGTDGKLYFSIGDRGTDKRAQDPADSSGSILRLNDDGSIPGDNPFVGRPGHLPELYSMGNRNPQGLAVQPGTGLIWESEHGPQGGDEINIIRAGANYGWPVITYGRTYGLGLPIGEGTEKPGMVQPELYFVPSLALAGMTFYTGDALPAWKGDLIVALLGGGLVRLDVEDDRVVAAERLLEEELGRTRHVAQGPDGALYALVDEPAPGGRLVRIDPQ